MACILWFIIFFVTVRIPVFLLVGFYVLTDIYGLAYLMDNDEINYIAHLAGAASGVLFAFLFYLFKPIWGRNESPAEPDARNNPQP